MTKPKYRHEGQDARAKATMRAEAERRGWLLWPKHNNRDCARHQYHAADLDDPCPVCFAEAMEWQRLRKETILDRQMPGGRGVSTEHAGVSGRVGTEVQLMRPAYSRARIIAEYKEHSADVVAGLLGISPNTVYRELRRAGVRVRRRGPIGRECKPKSAKRTERLWV